MKHKKFNLAILGKLKIVFIILFVIIAMNPRMLFNIEEKMENNLNKILESNEITSWDLQGIKSSQVEVFHDEINTSHWDLVDVSNIYFETLYSEYQNYLLDNYTFEGLWNYTETSSYIGDQDIFPEGIYWDGIYWWMIGSNSDEIHKYYYNWSYTGISYDISGQCTTPTDIFWDGINWWVLGDGVFDRVYQYYSNWSYTGISHYIGGQEPAPKGIFWDGTSWWIVGLNNRIVYQYTSGWSYTGNSHYIGGQDGYPSDLFWDGINWWVSGIYTDTIYKYYSNWSYTGISYSLGGKDDSPTDLFWDGISWWMLGYISSRVYKYGPDFYTISKNYFGNGYMYMQTNTTETIALQSPDYGTHYNLSNDNYFEVEFETNSDSQIDLILLKDGIINKTLILSQSGNTNFSQRIIQIFLDENAEFDQLKILATLENTDYVKVHDIKVKIEVPPTITINSPTSNELFGTTAPSFNVEIYHANLDSMWYTIDGGATNITFTTNGTINHSAWSALSDGVITIQFYANDTIGIIGFAEVSIRKDVNAPIITINNPQYQDVIGTTAPNFDISIVEPNLNMTWYSLNGGNNITFTGLTGTINQDLWDALSDGNVNIRFYANETLGRIGFKEVTVVKMTSQPSPPGIPGYNILLLLGIVSTITIIIVEKRLNHLN